MAKQPTRPKRGTKKPKPPPAPPKMKANAELDPVADAMPPVKPRVKPPVKPPENQHYDTVQWHSMPMFQCKHCRWSTLNEDDVIRHAAKHLVGTPRQEVRRTDTGLVTESGNAIVREEIVEPDEE